MSILNKLNENQRKAAEKIEGPVLILAGAGSGKTRTVTYRIAHMIKEKNISPLNILALTFTNKAAREMKERAEELIGEENSYNLVVSTFHSFAVRILKTYSERIGYGRNFNIYDVDDQKSIITKIKKEMNIKDDIAPGRIANRISKLKEDGVGLDEVSRQLDLKIPANRLFYDIYKKYDEVLKANNAMDFSDLLLNARRLLDDKYVLDIIQNRYQYIVVDEYQDTNNIQYEIINLIAAKYRNICVVGDEDQSIYAFRGANIENILNFEKDYPDAYTIKLERNYRSTKRILDTANELIRNNKSSKGKKLWTDGSEGEKIKIFNAKTPYDEAEFIVKEIKAKSKSGVDYKDMTILYRTNAQSRVLEEKLLEGNVPYKIYGGMQFFQRKEIKDILAYLNLLNNRNDNHNFYRIINVPKRSIGEKTLEKIAEIANERNIPMLDALQFVDETNIRGAVKNTLKDFYNMIQGIYLSLDELSVKEVFDEVITKTKYFDSIEDNKEDRIKNIEELLNSIIELEKRNPHISLADYLDMVSLTASTDEMEENENFVKLMTIHSSKGLEFDYVFIAGMEDGLFPSCSFESSEEDIEEERRLCYVAVTRAKKELYISYASERMTWGQMNYNRKPSRFIYEMKQDNLEYLVNNIITLSKTKKISSSSFREDKFQVKKENFNPFSIRKSKEIHETNSKYKVGDTVTHKKFGKGRIKHVDKKSLTIDFMVGEKKLALILAEKFLID
ncbi:ATP-dependent helicase [Leptotrichia sp. oral taxon 221]|uniref:ATP-dependent helicase n=1 Tax=Leptotrichia sp. oral taxon 221 TaxID=712362 RepID=UPI001B8B1931|nr:UvrD-helicase domain-containing protein [Leptotrichia sp. oral taxon 221]QUB97848.1 UvrD-helicase domain-containing protein [Leptotrichia sp. oral taxon 221]